jgi:hypothetical protein
MLVAGVVLETVPGAAPRVAARLLSHPGLSLCGGDGDRRLAAVVEAEDGRALERIADELLAADREVLGVYPTYVGAPDGAGADGE